MQNNARGFQWYLAELLEEARITGEAEHIVYNSLVLIRASSPEEAYKKALQRGKEREDNYEDDEGRWVTVAFRGLSDLNLIDGELEDGAEIIYEELEGISDEELVNLIPPKEQLGVFRVEE
ncbi:DUF4288 domain-containing protein [Tengunoibacter tsumagoiensis]|uniref:DUF4288 domain-containing protein n=1 Tax=Tengunoibacter tsumagoiensis TaxID=2014871 RepID=A0A402A4H4_9CHLR|nr:DUF4288 domain-containing protein [Tengunoibacter tsumagoiensis]GCE13969.1 hypothetical protein KTT_38280 [Tengunoibacter tsumagoiensis]